MYQVYVGRIFHQKSTKKYVVVFIFSHFPKYLQKEKRSRRQLNRKQTNDLDIMESTDGVNEATEVPETMKAAPEALTHESWGASLMFLQSTQ